jgi:predicted dithiol-disulfide oxidoreductase (DUF899 family)
MEQNNISFPEIVSHDDWLDARKKLLAKEKELTRQRDALNAERRRLPMVKIEKEYMFEGPDGQLKLIDLFEDRMQLIVYHFMFNPDWENGCRGDNYGVSVTGERAWELTERMRAWQAGALD